MTPVAAPYLQWAKTRPSARIDLASSNLLACSLDELPGAREALDLAGESPNGFAPLVKAIALAYGVQDDQVATAGGCSGANFLSIAALVDSGDEVLIESPTYDPLPAAARMCGATVTTFPRRFQEGYRIDPDRISAAIGPKTRLIVVTNPHNPSGVLAGEDEMEGLQRAASRAGVVVLVDEVYLDVVSDDRPKPAATRSSVFVSTNSLTKAYGLASLRCGWALASPEIARRIRRTRDIVDVWGAIPADRLSVLAFANRDRLARRARSIVEPNLGLLRGFLERRRDLSCVPPRATIAFPRVLGATDTTALVTRLFQETGVAVVPGSFFDSPAHFRVSLGGWTEKLSEGLNALERILDEMAR